MKEFYRALAEILERHGSCAIATVVCVEGSCPRDAGAKMVILPDGAANGTLGGGKLESEVAKDALESLRTRRAALKRYNLSEEDLGMKCGGVAEVYIEPVVPRSRLVIFGGGHVGKAIAKVALAAGLTPEVVDDREEHLRPEDYPTGAILIRTDDSFAEGFEPPGPADCVLVVTREAATDASLAGRYSGLCAYTGVMGSKTKLGFIRKTLKTRGVADEALDRIRCPMGLDIGADTPEEIALSVLAEIVALREGRAFHRRGTETQRKEKKKV